MGVALTRKKEDEPMSSKKMEWTQPQLIVLARGMPEESVLTFCKLIDPGAIGATDNTQNGCQDVNSPSQCGSCLSRSGT
jgi:hypothetical protein